MSVEIRQLAVLISLAGLMFSFPAGLSASNIEAVKGKHYKLTKRHGPWMIMVASLQDVPEERRTSGLSAQEAANALVYALRKKGIPAYTFSQKDIVEHVRTTDRRGRERTRSFLAQQGEISVIAGNYPSVNDSTAQKTLDYIKNFYPEFLKNDQSGAVYKKTPGRPKPFSGAFLTINPLLSPEEVEQQKDRSFLLKLNSGTPFSLLNNDGRYTLVVATFRGKSGTYLANGNFQEVKQEFQVTNSLDRAAMRAWRLTQAMRQAKSLGYKRNYEAYVYHDRHRSLVTVGSFNSLKDQQIAELKKLFKAKIRKNTRTGERALTAETFTIPRKRPANGLPDQTWIFDPNPQVMKVPRLR